MSYKLPLFAAAAFLGGYMGILLVKRYFFLQIFTRSVTGIISTIW